MINRTHSMVFLITLMCVDSSLALAQSANALEEVTVTARKRAESLQDVPVVVTAITQEDLETNMAVNLSTLAELAPQVVVGEYGTGTGAILTIRGISSHPIDAGLEQSVLVAFDGVPVAHGGVIKAALFDTKQVEVMQGPQALFFGKNSPAGVISIHSADPTDEFEGYVKLGYEFVADERFAEAVVSFPFTDTFGARLAVRGMKMDGWVDNVAVPLPNPLDPSVIVPGAVQGNTQPKGDDYAARLTLLWQPSESFSANFKVTGEKQKLNGNTVYFETYCVNGVTVPTILGIPEIGSDCNKDRRVNDSANPPVYSVNFPLGNNGVPYADSDLVFSSLNLDWSFDKFTLTSTTGYYDKTHSGTGTSFSPYSLFYSSDHRSYDLLTQELRINTQFSGAVNFMAGVYFEHANREWFNAADLFHIGIDPETGSYAVSQTIAQTEFDTWSIFGQMLWNITPSMELSVGARYSHDERDNRQWNTAVSPYSPLGLYPQDEVIAMQSKDTDTSPEVTLSWHPLPDQTLYAAYKTGYKAGGFSNPALLRDYSTPENLTFGSEETDGFEIGYKAYLADGRVRMDVAAYGYDYDGLQVVSVNSQFFDFLIGNAAAARTEGVQASFAWLATENLSIDGNVGWNDAKYESYPGAQCYPGQTEAQGCFAGSQDLSGTPLLRAPDLTFSLAAKYETQFIPGWTTILSARTSYSDSFQASSTNAPAAIQPSYWLINAGLQFIQNDGPFEFALIGRNLNDEYYFISSDPKSVGGADEWLGLFNRPREIAVTAAYRF